MTSSDRETDVVTRSTIPSTGLAVVVAQHASNAWCEQSLEFAAYLFLIVLFPTTLIPASVLGLNITLGSVLLSGWMGDQVDQRARLSFSRKMIVAQKSFQSIVYLCFAILFGPLVSTCGQAFSGSSKRAVTRLASLLLREQPIAFDTLEPSKTSTTWVYIMLGVLILSATCGRIATVGIDLAVDRDWILVISEHNTANLTTFNTSLRRTSLTCKLLAPLVVSFLTSASGTHDSTCVWVLLGLSLVTTSIELWWIGVLWEMFPVLAEDDARREREGSIGGASHKTSDQRPRHDLQTFVGDVQKGLVKTWKDWVEFAKMPVFLSSVAISCVYLTTLSFDGIMLSYLKVERSFSDVFISIMRGICVITGLIGTAIMPRLETKLGLVRAGAWSLWFEIGCLIPTVLCLYIGAGGKHSNDTTSPAHGSAVNILIFFTFLALSRIGLYSFDLIQLQSMQVALERHPIRNKFTALQVSMQSTFDLGKYLVVFILNRPEEFRWTGLVSLCAVILGGVIYLVYVHNIRGHLIHWGLKGHDKDSMRQDSHQYELVGSG